MKFETKFALKERVKIPELERRGKIKSIFVDDSGISYSVRYFDKAEAKSVYFDEDELEKI